MPVGHTNDTKRTNIMGASEIQKKLIEGIRGREEWAWWIAELSPHGYVRELIDGPHSLKKSAEDSLPLFMAVTKRDPAMIVIARVSHRSKD